MKKRLNVISILFQWSLVPSVSYKKTAQKPWMGPENPSSDQYCVEASIWYRPKQWVWERARGLAGDWVPEWPRDRAKHWAPEWPRGWAGDWVPEWPKGWAGDWVREWPGERARHWVPEWPRGWDGDWVPEWPKGRSWGLSSRRAQRPSWGLTSRVT